MHAVSSERRRFLESANEAQGGAWRTIFYNYSTDGRLAAGASPVAGPPSRRAARRYMENRSSFVALSVHAVSMNAFGCEQCDSNAPMLHVARPTELRRKSWASSILQWR